MKDPVKISSKVDADVWGELRRLSEESHQSLSGMLTEAIREYVRRRRLRPAVIRHLDDSIAANRELGRRLAE
jgi:predicted transcriptional regulator